MADKVINSNLLVDGKIKQGASYIASEDNTILYHSVKWFTPTAGATISTSGTTATLTGSTQFTSTMVGSKLTINGESRIITTYTSTSVVVLDSAYSQNYSAVSESNFGVYARALYMSAGGSLIIGNNTGAYTTQTTNLSLSSGLATSSNGLMIATTGILSVGSDKPIQWSSTTTANSTKDLGIRRSAAGVLEIYDGITNGTLKDVSLNNLNGNTISLNTALSTNQSYSGTIQTITAGEALTFGDVVYVNLTDGKFYKASASSATTTPAIGLVVSASIASSGTGTILLDGFVRWDSWTFGNGVWLSTTAGAVTSTQPSTTGNQIQRLGVAIATNKLHFRPSIDIGEK